MKEEKGGIVMKKNKLTIDDIARELQVSKTTVSRSISGKGRIGQATRDRVLQYIRENNYSPNAIAQGLAQQKTNNIGFVMPSDYGLVDMSFFQKSLVGICGIASTMDYDVLISMVGNDNISQLERLVENHKVDGVILSRTLVNDAPAEYLLEAGIPFVAIGTALNKNIIQVDNDHRSACRELTSILLRSGIQKMGLIGGSKEHVVTKKRLQGYMEAYMEKGIGVDNSLVYMDVDNSILTGHAVEEMLRREVDCIICMDDSICTYVLNKLHKSNIRVPEQIKIASFYNSTILENNIPSITSLQFDVQELGMITCKTLLDCIEGKQVQNRTLLGYEVSMKESTQL